MSNLKTSFYAIILRPQPQIISKPYSELKTACYRQLLSQQHREPQAAACRLLPAAQTPPASTTSAAAAVAG
jgi:hypothetical protein